MSRLSIFCFFVILCSFPLVGCKSSDTAIDAPLITNAPPPPAAPNKAQPKPQGNGGGTSGGGSGAAAAPAKATP